MAPPDLLEWVPTWLGPKPSLSIPISLTAQQMVVRNISDVILKTLFVINSVLTLVSGGCSGLG